MVRKFLLIITLVVPALSLAAPAKDIGKYLVGKWEVEGIKETGSNSFHPPRHPVKWEFTAKGDLIEELGKNGAKIHWQYHVVGRDIKVQLGNMAFSWRILTMEDNMMLVRHQLGLFKVKRK